MQSRMIRVPTSVASSHRPPSYGPPRTTGRLPDVPVQAPTVTHQTAKMEWNFFAADCFAHCGRGSRKLCPLTTCQLWTPALPARTRTYPRGIGKPLLLKALSDLESAMEAAGTHHPLRHERVCHASLVKKGAQVGVRNRIKIFFDVEIVLTARRHEAGRTRR